MSPEQPNTSSTGTPAPDGAAVTSGSDQPVAEESSKSPSWWDRILRRDSQGMETKANGEDQSQSATSAARSVSEEELARLVQAESDRRDKKRQDEEKRAARKRLRDTDPFAYVEEERKEELTQTGVGELQKFLANVGGEHDRVSIDPVVELLPKDERDRILKLEGAGTGLQGRKLVVSESLKALEKHWRAEGAKEAELKLRRNPAFRKQVLAEGRGSAVEPELLPAASASAPESSVSTLLRQRYGLGAR